MTRDQRPGSVDFGSAVSPTLILKGVKLTLGCAIAGSLMALAGAALTVYDFGTPFRQIAAGLGLGAFGLVFPVWLIAILGTNSVRTALQKPSDKRGQYISRLENAARGVVAVPFGVLSALGFGLMFFGIYLRPGDSQAGARTLAGGVLFFSSLAAVHLAGIQAVLEGKIPVDSPPALYPNPPDRPFDHLDVQLQLDRDAGPMASGFRPTCSFDTTDPAPLSLDMCELQFVGPESLSGGEACEAKLFVVREQQGYLEGQVRPGRSVQILEGPRRVGEARILRVVWAIEGHA